MDKEALKHIFSETFSAEPVAVYASPGRINLIGEHTEQWRFCLPLSGSTRYRGCGAS